MVRFVASSMLLILVLSCGVLADELPKELDMKNPRTPAEGLVTGGQPSQTDLLKLKEQGVKAVINLRQSVEMMAVLMNEEETAKTAGLSYFHLPISSADGITEANARMLDQLLKEAGGETLLHCGSGNRAGALLALRAYFVEGKSAEEALAFGKAAGLTGLEPKVREQLGLPQE